jgi:hypothetical protein
VFELTPHLVQAGLISEALASMAAVSIWMRSI